MLRNLNFNDSWQTIRTYFDYYNHCFNLMKELHKFLFDRLDVFIFADCVPVESLTGGYIVGDHHYGSEVKYFCNESFYLMNGNHQFCQFGGIWSKPKPYCKG